MATQKTEAEILAELDAAEAGEGKTVGLSWKVRATIFIKRNHYNVPVKTCAGIIGLSHSRVTEIASGRDYKRYSAEDRKTFIEAIAAEYAAIGLVYTGDYCGNNGSKKLPKPRTAAAAE
jgi:hypothetical protein